MFNAKAVAANIESIGSSLYNHIKTTLKCVKFRQKYDAADAYNALADLRALDMLTNVLAIFYGRNRSTMHI